MIESAAAYVKYWLFWAQNEKKHAVCLYVLLFVPRETCLPKSDRLANGLVELWIDFGGLGGRSGTNNVSEWQSFTWTIFIICYCEFCWGNKIMFWLCCSMQLKPFVFIYSACYFQMDSGLLELTVLTNRIQEFKKKKNLSLCQNPQKQHIIMLYWCWNNVRE